MKYSYKIVYLLLLCLLLFSCGAAKKASKSNIDELTLIKNAHEQGNVVFLINALEKYPSYRGYVETYLYDNDYSQADYKQLKRYAEAAQNDVQASMFFDSLMVDRQCSTIEYLSHLNVAAVARFYSVNCIEHDYLTEVLRDAYFNDIPSLDYANRKMLYKAFKSTNLCSEIEGPYNNLRDSILTDIISAFNPCFEAERAMLKQIEAAIRYEAQKYIEAGVEKIILEANKKNERGFFKTLFNKTDIDKYSFSGYVNKIINETYDPSFIEKLTKGKLVEFLASSREMRSLLFNQYFNEQKYSNIYIPSDVVNTPLVWVIGRDAVSNIQNIKDIGAVLTVGSLALGFVPGVGAIALAADAADFVYGLGQDNRTNQAIERLAGAIYNDSSKCIDEYLKTIFNGLTEAQQMTENNIKNIFSNEF